MNKAVAYALLVIILSWITKTYFDNSCLILGSFVFVTIFTLESLIFQHVFHQLSKSEKILSYVTLLGVIIVGYALIFINRS